MKQLFQVAEFHENFNHPVELKPTLPDMKRQLLRARLIREELEEMELAIQDEDLIEVVDGIIDLLYVVLGSALEFGISEKLSELFNEVHASNMSKLENGFPIYANDGKIMKGKDFVKPDLKRILEEK